MIIGTRRRTASQLLLAAAATAAVLGSLATIAGGSNAPAWSHWLCSPAALRSAVHTVGGRGGLGPTLLTALEVHWPHFLPILLGLATLVYLWRANARYHSQDGHGGVSGGASSGSAPRGVNTRARAAGRRGAALRS